MSAKLRVAIVEDHQLTRDGYQSRLGADPGIEIVGLTSYGEEFEQMLANTAVDVVILDVHVPTSAANRRAYPVMHVIPTLLDKYPRLAVMVVSHYTDKTLVQSILEAGASAYILKDDASAIVNLASLVRSAAQGSFYVSELARHSVLRGQPDEPAVSLTSRQKEVLSIYAAYPEYTTEQVAQMLTVKNSTVRNLLSSAYLRLHVPNRAAAVARAQELGLISPAQPPARPPAD